MSIFTTSKGIKSLALGKFDGLHIAHFELIKRLENGALIVIDKGKSSLTPFREKFLKIPCFYYDFDEIKELDGSKFVEILKRDFLDLEKIVVGYDFKFGKNRAYTAYDLPKIFDGRVEIVDEIRLDEVPVHSKVIREFLSLGECERVREFLGRFYEISGKVVRGQGLGDKLVRTINLEFDGYFVPKFGVYATKTIVNKKSFNSISFLGNRISTDCKFSLETHILDKNIEVCTKDEICVEFCKFIRENQKFENIELLKKQILRDISLVRGIL